MAANVALSPDGKRLAVGCSGERRRGDCGHCGTKTTFSGGFRWIELRPVAGLQGWNVRLFPLADYRQNPITAENIRRGWVIASRIGRLRLDGQARREAIALDREARRLAIRMASHSAPMNKRSCDCVGNARTAGLQVAGFAVSGLRRAGRSHRLRSCRIANGSTASPWAAGRWRFATRREATRCTSPIICSMPFRSLIWRAAKSLGPLSWARPQAPLLARQGEAIFYDAGRSLDQWYSCHSCHYEGHTNAATMDTRNDGRFGNFKTVLSLRVARKPGRGSGTARRPTFVPRCGNR